MPIIVIDGVENEYEEARPGLRLIVMSGGGLNGAVAR